MPPLLPSASSRGFNGENTPKFQCHVWIYKHVDALRGSDTVSLCSQGSYGVSPGTEARREPG